MADIATQARTELRDGTLWLTLDRPEAMNSLTPSMMHELESALDRLAEAPLSGPWSSPGRAAPSAPAPISRLCSRAASRWRWRATSSLCSRGQDRGGSRQVLPTPRWRWVNATPTARGGIASQVPHVHGDRLAAPEARAIGLVHVVAPDGRLEEVVVTISAASQPPS